MILLTGPWPTHFPTALLLIETSLKKVKIHRKGSFADLVPFEIRWIAGVFRDIWRIRGILKIDPEIMGRVQNGEDIDSSLYYFRTTSVLETGSEKYIWLNQIICVGIGKVEKNRVRYSVYQIL